jgi:hypothetical protein
MVVDQELIVQNCSERHIERTALARITVHFAALAGFKMTDPSAAPDDLSVLRDLDSLGDAFGRHG